MHSYYHHTGRRVFFWTLTVLYVILISMIIPYAFGYRFSFERGVFVYAGSITVKSNPRTVTVTIDDHTDDNPNYINNTYHINGITPGEHTIHITRDGFQSINKTVSISSGISTELWNVLLPRTSYDRTLITTLSEQFFYRAPHDALIAAPVVNDDTTLAVSVVDSTNLDNIKTTTLLPKTRAHLTPDDTRNIEWSRDADALIVPAVHHLTDTSTQNDALILAVDGTTTISLRALFPGATTIGAVRWNPQAQHSLYAHIDNTLTEITLPSTPTSKEDIRTTPIASDVRAYTIADNTLYYLTNRTGVIHKITRSGASEQVTTVPTTLDENDTITMTVYDDDRIVLRATESGTLEFFDKTRPDSTGVIAHNIRGTHFSDDGKKILYWSTNEIFVRFVRAWDVQPLRSAGDTLTLARFAGTIDNVQWTDDYEHVLYTTDDALKITSLDGRGGHTTHTITPLRTPSIVRADHDAGRLYITETADDTYPFFFITFPEKEGLF